MDKYHDREDAGKKLAAQLAAYAGSPDTLVLALPRGGVPVAYPVAKQLKLPLDVFIVRKLGVPHHTELAMGAIATGGTVVYNQDIIDDLQITQGDIENSIAQETAELRRRETAYRGDRPYPAMRNQTIILIDDGIATGATMRAAIKALRALHVKHIVVAVPVAETNMCDKMVLIVDEFICPLRPKHFYAVGAWYENFSQTEDEEVRTLLQLAEKNGQH